MELPGAIHARGIGQLSGVTCQPRCREGSMGELTLVPIERIEWAILFLRGHKVMLDSDLAELYGVQTGALNRAVRRNLERFPPDFMFQLSVDEEEILKCQFGISRRHGGSRHLPFAFTEQGVAMLSSVLRSPRAVRVNIDIMRAFAHPRQLLQSNAEMARKLVELEKKVDAQLKVVFDAIRGLMAPPERPKGRIGFGG
jgi:hypothetical protein